MSTTEPKRLAYFPGCMSTDCARELDASLRAVFGALDVELVELSDWNCCGGDVLDSVWPGAGKPLAQRLLTQAADIGDELVCACPACVCRLRAVESDMTVSSALDVLAAPHCLSLIEQRIEEKLEGITVACYYGPVRTDATTGREETPPMERLVRACGPDVVKWSGRRKPHGGYSVFTAPGLMRALAGAVLTEAIDAGADLIVLDDPHAQFNLDLFRYPIGRELKRAVDIPALFCTELVAHALGLPVTERCYRRHVTSPFRLFLDYYDRRCAVVSKEPVSE